MHASFIIHEGMYPVVFLVRPHKESVDKRLRKGIPASVPNPQCLKITQNVAFQFLTIFGIFNELLSTQNVNVARFARNVE